MAGCVTEKSGRFCGQSPGGIDDDVSGVDSDGISIWNRESSDDGGQVGRELGGSCGRLSSWSSLNAQSDGEERELREKSSIKSRAADEVHKDDESRSLKLDNMELSLLKEQNCSFCW